MASTRQAGLRRTRSVVALCRGRLADTRAGRAGRTLARLCASGFAVAAVALRVSDGAEASLSGLTLGAAHWVVWLAGVPLAYAAAADRASLDRREGVEALAAARGISPASLEAARAVAAMTATTSAIGVPLVLLALLTAALAGRGSAVLARAGLAAGAVIVAVVAGVTLGGVGAICGRVGRARGRWLLFTVLVVPWALADLAGHGSWSIPSAIGAVLESVLGGRHA
jgi:hypothetical protein